VGSILFWLAMAALLLALLLAINVLVAAADLYVLGWLLRLLLVRVPHWVAALWA